MDFEMFLGFGIKDATIEYSTDGLAWETPGDVVLNQGPGLATYTANTTVPFNGLAARYVRLTINSSWQPTAPSHGLSEVRFMYIPVQPRDPQPDDGAANVAIDADLSWRPGREAVSHQVYLGTDPNALTQAGTTTQSRYSQADLDLDTTYYWQIVEVNDASLDITERVTLSVWVRPMDAGNSEHTPYIAKGDHQYAIKENSGNAFEFFIYNGGWFTVTFPTDDSFNGQWHHVAGSYDGRNLRLYVDGVHRRTRAQVGVIDSSTYPVNLGRNSENTDRLYQGDIDEARIYSGALSAAAIAELASP